VESILTLPMRAEHERVVGAAQRSESSNPTFSQVDFTPFMFEIQKRTTQSPTASHQFIFISVELTSSGTRTRG
jgi:hypothetical protein